MLSKTVAALILAGVALAQTFSISTPPSIQQCQPAALNWVGGTAPYILAAIPQGQTSAAALLNIADNVSGTSYTWNVNLAQGTAINIRITDATGAIAYSSGLTVQAGGSGCLSGSASAASGSAAPTTAVPASSGAGTAAPSASVTSRPPTSASSAPAASSGSPSSSSGAPSSAGTTSRPSSSATGAAQSPTSAANAKVAFNLPVLALAGVGAFVFLGGFAALA